MKKKSLFIQKTAVLTLFLSQIAFAQAGADPKKQAPIDQSSQTQGVQKPLIEIGDIGFGGNGCPSGSGPKIKDPQFDKKIVFEPLDFYLEAGKDSKRLIRKTCNLSIPVKVPQGISLSFDNIDFSGNLDLEKGDSLRFSAEYFVAGQKGPKLKRTFKGPKTESFNLISPSLETPQNWTKCGESVNLRINTSLLLRSKATSENKGFAVLNAIKIGNDLRGSLKWKKCR